MRVIIYLQPDGAQSAADLNNEDVIQMPTAIAAVLQAVWDRLHPTTEPFLPDLVVDLTWLNWAAASRANYEEFWNYGMDLLAEHHHRFGSKSVPDYRHGSTRRFEELSTVPPALGPRDDEATPDPFPVSPEQARNKYPRNRLHYTRREVPAWLTR